MWKKRKFGKKRHVGCSMIICLMLALSGCFDSKDIKGEGTATVKVLNSTNEAKEVLFPVAENTPLDTVQFGKPESEAAHQFTEEKTVTGTGGLGDSLRQINPRGYIEFEMKVDPDRQNYLTVKLWGSDTGNGGLFLVDSMFPNLDVFKPRISTDWPELDKLDLEPAFAGRYFYSTYPIPMHLTKNRSIAKIKLISTGLLNFYTPDLGEQKGASRGIYKAYTHANPFLKPVDEKQDQVPALSDKKVQNKEGLSQYDYMVEQANIALKLIVS